MTHRLTLYIILAAFTAAIAGCTGSGDDTAIPRRTAYPRPATMDTVMTVPDSLPVSFAVNASATVSRPRLGWLDVAYPAYGATMHVTFTPVDTSDIDEVRANRVERLTLNSGGRPSVTREAINAAGFDYLTVRTDGAATPLQFLATDGRSIVVSGAVYMFDPAAASAVDSIQPIVDAIEADINRSMIQLK